MKKTIIISIISLMLCWLIPGYNNNSVTKEKEICAYITSIDKNKVICKEVEYVTREDT